MYVLQVPSAGSVFYQTLYADVMSELWSDVCHGLIALIFDFANLSYKCSQLPSKFALNIFVDQYTNPTHTHTKFTNLKMDFSS